jgi:hypothetical protein
MIAPASKMHRPPPEKFVMLTWFAPNAIYTSPPAPVCPIGVPQLAEKYVEPGIVSACADVLASKLAWSAKTEIGVAYAR